MWDVPGGFCDAGEHPIATATREVFEETGIRIRITGYLGIWLDEYGADGGNVKRTLNIYYHAVPIEQILPVPDNREVAEIGFFAADQLPLAIAFPRHVPAAIDAWKVAVSSGQLITKLFDRLA
jgi:8-oxo-dGTP pyrophosphatase MutT (NUDIX family)